MRSRAGSTHREAVQRRLELLREEIALPARPDAGPVTPEAPGDESAPAELGRAVAPVSGLPGRHAARRGGRGLDRVVPAPLRGRVEIGPWHLVVVTLVVVAGLIALCWWTLRSSAAPVDPVPPTPVAATTSASAAPADSRPSSASTTGAPTAPGTNTDESEEPAEKVTVDVDGHVRRPGIVVLPAGSRVVDAVEAAGGASKPRHLRGINLAEPLQDGQQIVVEAGGGPAGGGAASGPGGESSTELVNLNSASGSDLETLPGVGPVTAAAILDWRERYGGFTAVEELLEVDGIGEKTLATLAPLVTL